MADNRGRDGGFRGANRNTDRKPRGDRPAYGEKKFGERKFGEKKPYGAVRLTERGMCLAQQLEARRDSLLLLFSRRFSLSPAQSGAAATLLISGLEEESLALLEAASREDARA